MGTFEEKELKLYHAFVKEKDNISILRKMAEVIGNPIYIFDSTFSFLISSPVEDYAKAGKINVDKNSLILKEMELNSAESEINKLTNSDEIVTFDFQDVPCPIMARRIFDGEDVLGYVSIYGSNKEFDEDDKKLLQVICSITSKDLSIREYPNKIRTLVFEKILNGKIVNKKETDDAFDYSGINKENYKVVAFRSEESQFVYELLSKMHNNLTMMVYKKDVLLIIDSDRFECYDLEEIGKMLNEKINCKLSVSDTYKMSINLLDAYNQSLKLLEIGSLYNPNKIIYFYEDFKMQLLLSKIDRNILESSIDKRIVKILNHDNSSATNYMKDLMAYFKANRNINKAAEALYVHKNSMYYRLAKVKELFDIDLDNNEDCFGIETSLYIIDYLNKTKKQR